MTDCNSHMPWTTCLSSSLLTLIAIGKKSRFVVNINVYSDYVVKFLLQNEIIKLC